MGLVMGLKQNLRLSDLCTWGLNSHFSVEQQNSSLLPSPVRFRNNTRGHAIRKSYSFLLSSVHLENNTCLCVTCKSIYSLLPFRGQLHKSYV